MSTGLKVAFFINGPEKHGIVRASSIIADALCRVNDCSVTVVRSNDPIANPNASDHFCVVLNEADVVIIHAPTELTIFGVLPEIDQALLQRSAREFKNRSSLICTMCTARRE